MKRLLSFCLALGLVTLATSLEAQGAPDRSGKTGRHGSFPFLHRPGDISLQHARPFRQGPDWIDFVDRHGPGWTVSWNRGTDTPHRIYGGRAVLEGPSPSSATFGSDARAIVADHQELLGVQAERLRLVGTDHVVHLLNAVFEDTLGGLPVRGSRIEVRVHERGHLLLLGADTFPPGTRVPDAVRIDPATALANALAFVGADGDVEPLRLQEVVYGVPTEKALEPARGFEIIAADWQVFVNGVDGQVDYARPISWDVIVEGSAEGQGTPGMGPDVGGNPPVTLALPFLQFLVDGQPAITNASGDFSVVVPGNPPNVTLEATLTGPFVTVNDVTGNPLTFTQTVPTGQPALIEFNLTPSELETSQVNAFVHTNLVHSFLKEIDPGFSEMDFSINCNVNLSQNCNAFFSGTSNSINFFDSGGGCPNTCYSSVVYHEYGHATVQSIYGFGNWPHGSYNEGIADVTSVLLADDPVVGQDFFGPGTSVRNVDTQDRVYPDDVNNPIHDAGLIVGGSYWDTRVALVGTLGDPAALERIRLLYFGSLQLEPPVISPDITIDVLMIDDDDGLLFNGTPNYDAIQAGFGAHGLDAPPLAEVPLLVEEVGDLFDDTMPIEVTAFADALTGQISAVTLYYSTDEGQNYTAVPMVFQGGVEYSGSIPPIPSPAHLFYYVEAETTTGQTGVQPPTAPEQDRFITRIGFMRVLGAFGFEDSELEQWTSGADQNEDDWEWGRPGLVLGSEWDPEEPAEGEKIWGNDLGLAGGDRRYSNNTENYLRSPELDGTGFQNLRLDYRRWLTVEEGNDDLATVSVNGNVVFSNPAVGDLLDESWTRWNHDISFADGQAVTVEYRLDTDGSIRYGGWNVDSVEVYELIASDFSPVVDSLFPFSGPLNGTYEVTLQGSGFVEGVTTVTFGTEPLENIVVLDWNTLVGNVPPGAEFGSVDVTVANAGQVGNTIVDGFTYVGSPTISSVTPDVGFLVGGQGVSIVGTDFSAALTEVRFGDTELAIIEVVSPTLIYVITPSAAALGAVDVSVSTYGVEDVLPGGFTYVEDPALVLSLPSSFEVPLAADVSMPLELANDWPVDGFSAGFSWDPQVLVPVAFSEIGGTVETADFLVPSLFPVEGEFTIGVVMDLTPPIEDKIPVSAGAPLGFLEVTTAAGATVGASTPLTWQSGLGDPPVAIVCTVDAISFDPLVENGGAVVTDPQVEAQFIRGEINNDGNQDIADAVFLLSFLFIPGSQVPTCDDAADVNDDGMVDVADPTYLLSSLFVIGSADPPAPFPACGTDPTSDGLECASFIGCP